VVAFVRTRSGTRRVGHAGTLDPFAEGVLPVCLGKATRVIEYLMDARKCYRAVVRLGVQTDTHDRTGLVVEERDPGFVEREEVKKVLQLFVGKIAQRPPIYSALKRQGVPLYRLARSGIAVETDPREVTVHSLGLTAWQPPLFEIEVECGKGTYVRALVRDIGDALATGASLDTLTRTRVGPFGIEDAVGIDALRDEFASGAWRDRLLGLDEVLLEWPAAILAEDKARKLRNGMSVTFAEVREAGDHARAYSPAGNFVAVLRRETGGGWRPAKVL
jgi:tRNA pseudouridine55 synthase